MHSLAFITLGLSLVAVRLAEDVSAEVPPQSSGECETEDMSAMQRFVENRMLEKQTMYRMPNDGESTAIGLLILTYAYPTQPGDIDDKRTFCAVDDKYQCLDGFSIVKAEVHGLTFEVAQAGIWNDTLEEGFTNALRALLTDERVKAITANCGFMTNYADRMAHIMKSLHNTEETPVKPIMMGTLELGGVFTGEIATNEGTIEGWNLLGKDDRALVVTANSETLGPRFFQIMEQAGIQDAGLMALLQGKNVSEKQMEQIREKMYEVFGVDDPSLTIGSALAAITTAVEMSGKRGSFGLANTLRNSGRFFRTYGAQDVPGFGEPVAKGTAHNGTLAHPYMIDWTVESLFRIEFFQPQHRAGRVKAKFVLMECTELPLYSNAVRIASRLPVWDISTLAQCLMACAPSYQPFEEITQNKVFKACMMDWTDPYKFETRFGKQPNTTVVHYFNNTGIPARHVEDFDWGLLGKPTGDRCTRSVGCFP